MEKSTKLFFNCKKKHGIQNRVQKFFVKEKEITNPKEMSNNNKVFYETLFKQNSSKTNIKKQVFLSSLDIKTSTNQQSNIWENEI